MVQKRSSRIWPSGHKWIWRHHTKLARCYPEQQYLFLYEPISHEAERGLHVCHKHTCTGSYKYHTRGKSDKLTERYRVLFVDCQHHRIRTDPRVKIRKVLPYQSRIPKWKELFLFKRNDCIRLLTAFAKVYMCVDVYAGSPSSSYCWYSAVSALGVRRPPPNPLVSIGATTMYRLKWNNKSEKKVKIQKSVNPTLPKVWLVKVLP